MRPPSSSKPRSPTTDAIQLQGWRTRRRRSCRARRPRQGWRRRVGDLFRRPGADGASVPCQSADPGSRAGSGIGPPGSAWDRALRPRGGSGIVQVQRDLDVQPAASLRDRFRPRGQALAGVHQPGGHLVAPAGHVAQLVSLRSEDLDGERIVAVLGLPPKRKALPGA